MPIIAKSGDRLIPMGTGFVVSPDGLMMTARHVLTGVSDALGGGPEFGRRHIDGELMAVYVTARQWGASPDNLVGGFLPITHAWFPDFGDVGLCWLSLPELEGKRLNIPAVRLSPGLPTTGDPVTAVGYHAMHGMLDEADPITIHYHQQTLVAEGHILDIHSPFRDRGMGNFPCFHTDATMHHGMSGGPIFNGCGNVCGVVSWGSEALGYYGALLWAAFGCSIEVAPAAGEEPKWMTLYEMAKRGHVIADETLAHVIVTGDGAGERRIELVTPERQAP